MYSYNYIYFISKNLFLHYNRDYSEYSILALSNTTSICLSIFKKIEKILSKQK